MKALIRREGRWPKFIAIILVAVTLCWAAWVLREAWASVEVHERDLHGAFLALAFLLLLLSLVAAFPSFLHLVRVSSGVEANLRVVSRLYFVSQMMKHLPGRFFGIAYQAMTAPALGSPAQWTGINIAYMLLSLGAAAGIGTTILAVRGVLPLWTLISALVALAGCAGVLRWLAGRVPTLQGKFWTIVSLLASATGKLFRPGTALPVIGWFGISWVVYLLAWAAFGAGLGESAWTGVELCALYSVSWVLGFVSLVTPSGLGVRELAFAALASNYGPDLVLYVAVAARFALLVADLVLGICQFALLRAPR